MTFLCFLPGLTFPSPLPALPNKELFPAKSKEKVSIWGVDYRKAQISFLFSSRRPQNCHSMISRTTLVPCRSLSGLGKAEQ